MLKRINRLTRKRDFDNVYRHGSRLAGNYVVLRTVNNHKTTFRVGIAVPTKVNKLATIRNRHKRHIRETIKEIIARLPTGWDVIIVVNRGVKERQEWSKFREEIRTLFRKQYSV